MTFGYRLKTGHIATSKTNNDIMVQHIEHLLKATLLIYSTPVQNVDPVRTERLFIQDSGDGNSATSDGIFVYLGEVPAVSVGDEIAATGNATDMFLNTQITVDNVASDLVSGQSGKH